MPATIIAIAEAITVQLNSQTFSQSFTATRHYQPLFDLASLTTLRVSVVPRGLTSKTLDRSRDTFDYEIDIAVQQKIEPVLVNLDALMALVEEVADHFRQNPLNSYPGARCLEVRNAPVFASEHLQELRLFTSVLTLVFRIAR